MDVCECCGSTDESVGWAVWDDNAEVMLCDDCVRSLRGIGESVERLDAQWLYGDLCPSDG